MQIEKQSAQIERLTKENEQLHAEIRHLKKLKGKPKIKPNTQDKNDQDNNSPDVDADDVDVDVDVDVDQNNEGNSNNNTPPKGKRSRSQEPGETAAPPLRVDKDEVCSIDNPGEDWRFKCYIDFHHTELELRFVTTRYRREHYQTPEGNVTAPLPAHVKGRFGDNLKAHALDWYHSCGTTQPLLLAWMHDHHCSISEGSLNKILTEGHDAFHQEKEQLLEAGLACSRYIQTDDTGARHQGQNGYCLFVGNPYFSYFLSSQSKSRINFLNCLLGQKPLYVLNTTATQYMRQVNMSAKWIDALTSCDEQVFTSKKDWDNYLDSLGCKAVHQRRWATEGALKAALMRQHQLEHMIVHSDGARQFDTVFEHGLCWYHAGRPLDKLIPANDLERAARDWMQDQYWRLYDDIKAYQESPTEEDKHKLYKAFDQWIATQTLYPDLQKVLGQLKVVREELLLVLEYPWLPLHNNLSERQIREYVKRRKVSGGTRSELGRKCRDTFASLKKTCKQHGISFAHYLKDRLSGEGQVSRLPDLIIEASSGNNLGWLLSTSRLLNYTVPSSLNRRTSQWI